MKPRWQRRVENVGAAVIILALSLAVALIALAVAWRIAVLILS